jgi:hypothetical protein
MIMLPLSIPADARLQRQIDVTWWGDHSCSGVIYAVDIFSMGPKESHIGNRAVCTFSSTIESGPSNFLTFARMTPTPLSPL